MDDIAFQSFTRPGRPYRPRPPKDLSEKQARCLALWRRYKCDDLSHYELTKLIAQMIGITYHAAWDTMQVIRNKGYDL